MLSSLRRYASRARGVAHARAASFVSFDGVPTPPAEAKVSIFDVAFLRGNGAFEVCRVLPGGRLRAPELHLARLLRTAAALDLPLPPIDRLRQWLAEAAASGSALDAEGGGSGDGAVRLLATRGGRSAPAAGGAASLVVAEPTVIIAWERLPTWPESMSLLPMCAPWHPAGEPGWETAKWLSYATNVRSTAKAQAQGYDDALLTTRSGTVLDGPNFAVGWFSRVDGGFESPSWQQLGMLQSVTCTLACRAAAEVLEVPVREGAFSLRHVLDVADEMVVLSSTRDALPVRCIGLPVGVGAGGAGGASGTATGGGAAEEAAAAVHELPGDGSRAEALRRGMLAVLDA